MENEIKALGDYELGETVGGEIVEMADGKFGVTNKILKIFENREEAEAYEKERKNLISRIETLFNKGLKPFKNPAHPHNHTNPHMPHHPFSIMATNEELSKMLADMEEKPSYEKQ